jgi:hypothetical protein
MMGRSLEKEKAESAMRREERKVCSGTDWLVEVKGDKRR